MKTISSEGVRNWTPDSLTDARTLLLAISTTEFIRALVIATECLKYLLGLTRSLQAEAKDIVQAVSEINTVNSTLQDLRNNVEKYHNEWFADVEKMCESIGVEPSLPRLCGHQRHRSNIPTQTPSEDFRRTITIPILDHLLGEIKTRFDCHQQTALQGLYLVPSVLVTKKLEEVSLKIEQVGDLYADDLPFRSSLLSEFHCWYISGRTKRRNMDRLLSPLHSIIRCLKHLLFPYITVLLQILCTLPVTSCSSERSFSSLKRIKTPLRSTMSNE